MPLQLRALHSSFNTSNVEFYSWTKLDNHAQRVTFRAPVAQKDLLLAASGVLVPFLINLVCRDDAARASRDSTSSVVWLGKRGYPEALTLIKQLEGHLGLAMSKESFGVRCASTWNPTWKAEVTRHQKAIQDFGFDEKAPDWARP